MLRHFANPPACLDVVGDRLLHRLLHRLDAVAMKDDDVVDAKQVSDEDLVLFIVDPLAR